ncbi:MAG: hypothetical protein GXY37_00555 [Chloroflexi bacterium]|nr:hypothetical protein [Chloroflexota bacterium]
MSQIANSADTERVERSESDCLQQLVIACQEDRTRFQGIYLLFIKPVFAYILRLVRNRELAEDPTSETFIKAFTSICQLNRPEKFTAWIFTIARNKTIDFFQESTQESVYRI